MDLKNSKIFNSQTMQAVSAFCESQEIKDIDNFIYLCFKQGFDIKKYGLLGKTLNEGEKDLKTVGVKEKQLIKEIIVEKLVEVPVEVIKEIEVIKEVPIDRVVEKIIYTTDDNQLNELGEKNAKLEIELLRNSEQLNELLSKIEHLNGEISIKTTEIDNIRQEFSTKTEEMENIFQNEMSKKDVELDELRQKLDDPVTNNKVNMLQETLQNLRNELQQKNEQIKELEKINRDFLNGNQNQAYLLKGSNLNRKL
jgi:chromosome segregation ATPase